VRAASLLLAAALAPLPAAADCTAPATQIEMNSCAAADLAAADAELNRLYREVKVRLGNDPAALHLLTLAQRAWIGYRDAECDFATSGVAGGSIYPTVQAGCLTRLTTDRVADFREYLSCAEGSLACPLPPA
jgi:uncharacterized protein YecT (DUF1311 family)